MPITSSAVLSSPTAPKSSTLFQLFPKQESYRTYKANFPNLACMHARYVGMHVQTSRLS